MLAYRLAVFPEDGFLFVSCPDLADSLFCALSSSLSWALDIEGTSPKRTAAVRVSHRSQCGVFDTDGTEL